jgi:hypothetical protein
MVAFGCPSSALLQLNYLKLFALIRSDYLKVSLNKRPSAPTYYSVINTSEVVYATELPSCDCEAHVPVIIM